MVNIINITRYKIRSKRLAPWVKFFWQIDAVNADFHYKPLPTDCIDVILNLADDMIYETEFDKIVAPRFHINGLRSKYSFIHQEKTVCIFGISFYPFGLFPFLHKSLSEMQNKVVNLYEFSPDLAQKLNNAVIGNTTEEIIAAIENSLIEELSVDKNLIRNVELISEFIAVNDNLNVRYFCNERSINIKTFERMVLYYTGYTPKVLCCIRRFQNVSNQLTHQRLANLIDITYDNNFTDQAHFIKDFKRFSGKSPRSFQSEKITVKENAKYTYR